MSDLFSVRPADLRVHGGHVEAVADGVVMAKEAGQAVRAGADAYGKLCVMVPAMLGALQDVLIEGIADSAHALRDTGERLRATADHYEGTDQARAEAISQIGQRL